MNLLDDGIDRYLRISRRGERVHTSVFISEDLHNFVMRDGIHADVARATLTIMFQSYAICRG